MACTLPPGSYLCLVYPDHVLGPEQLIWSAPAGSCGEPLAQKKSSQLVLLIAKNKSTKLVDMLKRVPRQGLPESTRLAWKATTQRSP